MRRGNFICLLLPTWGTYSNVYFSLIAIRHYGAAKRPIINGKYSQDACLDNDPKNWIFDCFFSKSCCNADITEAAYLVFNMLCNAAPSTIRRECKRRRVPNARGSGYHYETICEPERFVRIDF